MEYTSEVAFLPAFAVKTWRKRRKQGSCIVCKKKKLVYVCTKPVKFLVCGECFNRNKGPCLTKNKTLPRHKWQATDIKLDVGDSVIPPSVPKEAWFFCTQCEIHLV